MPDAHDHLTAHLFFQTARMLSGPSFYLAVWEGFLSILHFGIAVLIIFVIVFIMFFPIQRWKGPTDDSAYHLEITNGKKWVDLF